MEGRSKVVADAQVGIKPSREVRVAQFGPQWPHYGEVRIPDIAAPKCLSLEKTIQVFAWTTCLDALHRWRREALAAGFTKLPALPAKEPGEDECYAAGDGALADGVAVLESGFLLGIK